MNITGFNNALDRAMGIEANTQGNQVNALGNTYTSYDNDDTEHLAQFNKGLAFMDRFHDNQINY